MNRDVKFIGQRIDNKKWIIGRLISASKDGKPNSTDFVEAIQVIDEDGFKGVFKVIPETIGQFAGFKDTHGTDVYEGDVLEGSAKIPYEIVFENGSFIGKNEPFIILPDELKTFEITKRKIEVK